MLKLVNITKDYYVADTTVQALKGINLNFRANEFVSVLGPSGCGKTTLLNIIGGLDKCTSGDLAVFGKSTREYKDRDWDVYRNHRIGFIFQSYNLIPHQTVLGNVELALTIAGMNKADRAAKAKAALDKVGLSDQYYKRPNQLSGGQCQRVAIARALVNDPEILLADEPTGALDTVTSGQIMELIKEIARERLVIMVTHNPELAEEYSTRIIRLLDGLLVSDTNPFTDENEGSATAAALADKAAQDALTLNAPKKEKAKMSFWTAFKLSMQNLFTKKRRTLMTSIAGSIGIIGVSLVLSVSYGVQSFINKMQNELISGFPITISETALDLSAMMQSNEIKPRDIKWEKGKINVDSTIASLVNRSDSMSNIMKSNEITKEYIDYVLSIPPEQAAAIMLDYGLDLSYNLYTDFTPAKAKPVYTDKASGKYETNDDDPQTVSLALIKAVYASILQESEYAQYAPYIDMLSDSFVQLPAEEKYIMGQYKLLDVEGCENKYATGKNEVMLVLRKDSWLSDLLLAQLGFYTQNEFMNMVFRATKTPEKGDGDYIKEMDKFHFEYKDIIGKTFTYYPNSIAFKRNSDRGQKVTLADANDTLDDSSHILNAYETDFAPAAAPEREAFRKEKGIPLKIVGILEPNEDLLYGTLNAGFFYTEALRDEIFKIEEETPSDILLDLIEENDNAISSKIATNSLERMFEGIITGAVEEVTDAFTKLLVAALELPEGTSLENALIYMVFVKHLLTQQDLDDYLSSMSAEPIPKYTMEGVVFKYSYVYPYGGDNNPKTTYAAVGAGNMFSAMANLFGDSATMMGGDSLGGQMMDGIKEALNAKTLSLRALSGRRLIRGEADPVTGDREIIFNEPIANTISIYPVNFEQKKLVKAHLARWNQKTDDKKNLIEFTYVNLAGETVTVSADRSEVEPSDPIDLIIQMVNTFIRIITIALICFTSLALVVSTVMIAIITYVSVVERIKEIGVIRSLGGRKRDVSNLFTAETVIIGAVSGLIGIGFTYFASWIINLIVRGAEPLIKSIAKFPLHYAVIMLGVSVFLTLISGILPSMSAARKDPVVALRTE